MTAILVMGSLAGCGAAPKAPAQNPAESMEGASAESAETSPAGTTEASSSASTSTVSIESTESTESTGETVVSGEAELLPVQISSVWDGVTDSEGRVLIKVQYPKVSFGSYVEGSFQPAENLEALSEAVKSECRLIRLRNEANAEHFREQAASDYEIVAGKTREDGSADYEALYQFFDMYYFKTRGYVKRADTTVCSLLFREVSYAAGVHPNYAYYGACYDSMTGKRLYIKDVLQKADGFAAFLEDTIRERYPDYYDGVVVTNTQEILQAQLDEEDNEDGMMTFALTKDALVVVINPYDIAAYAYGSCFVTFPFADYPDLVKPEYTRGPERYAEMVAEGEPVRFRTATGIREISWDRYEEESDEFYGLHLYLTLDGSTTEYQYDVLSSPTVYLMHTVEKNYLYVDCYGVDDYHELLIYDLSGDKPELVPYEAGNDGWPGDITITDPDQFVLMTRTDLLSTYTLLHPARMGEDGIPVHTETMAYPMQHEDYKPEPLVLKQDATFLKVSEDGEELGSEALAAGTAFHIERVSDEEHVDLKTEDGRLFRLHVYVDTEDSWVLMAEDRKAADLFDGMMFSG